MTDRSRITLTIESEQVAKVDRASLEARSKHGNYVGRSELICAALRRVDLPKLAEDLARGRTK